MASRAVVELHRGSQPKREGGAGHAAREVLFSCGKASRSLLSVRLVRNTLRYLTLPYRTLYSVPSASLRVCHGHAHPKCLTVLAWPRRLSLLPDRRCIARQSPLSLACGR